MNESFGVARINSVRYWSNKNKKWQNSNIKDLKVLAVLGKINGDGEPGRWNRGHNICIVFGEYQKEIYEDIVSEMRIDSKYSPFTIYLIGENGVKIPVLCAEGSGYDEHYKYYDEKTDCIFAYLPAMIFDLSWDDCKYNHPDIEYPRNKEKGE